MMNWQRWCCTTGGGVVQDFFRVGKILQVEITVTIDKNHGCKKIFWKFHLFNPPPRVRKFENPHYRVKNERMKECHFSEKQFFGWFFGFFSWLVCPIELILCSLVLYFSPDRFWYPYIKFTTTFIFDLIMGIFKFSDPRWRVKEVEFLKNLFTSMILIYSDSDFHL